MLLLFFVLGTSLSGASRYDPVLRFRVLVTPHFFIYFHQREDEIARRFAGIAEEVHRDLTTRLAFAPRGRTHVILVDQNDSANGWATPLPYDTIEITVVPPAPREVIGNTNDWLRLVFAHEYTHILQLDRSRGYASVVRYVLGRSPLAFPNLFLPPWQTEGLATYEESATTGRGRVYAGDFHTIVTQSVRERRALPLDRATSDFDNWPGGNTPYAYGGFFHEYLARTFGEAKLAELSSRTAGRFYFVSSPAFKATFGKSLGDLWRDFLAEERPGLHGGPLGNHTASRRVTTQGFVVTGPRFVEGNDGQAAILYSSRTADDFPALMIVDGNGKTRRVALRNSGEQASVSHGAVLFDQEDLSKSIALRSDLYRLDLSSGGVEWLTAGGRLVDPAVSSNAERIAAVGVRAGQRRLLVWDVPDGAWPADVGRLRRVLAADPRLNLGDADAEFASPRWSPDGRWLAAARVRRDGPSEIVLIDGSSGAATILVSSTDARNVTPTWTPDGRSVLFASDRRPKQSPNVRMSESSTVGPPDAQTIGPPRCFPFNIYSVDVVISGDPSPTPGAVRQVTDLASGASYPEVSSDGRTLAYVGYTSAGYDIFVTDIAQVQGPMVRRSESPSVGPKVQGSESQGSEGQGSEGRSASPSSPRLPASAEPEARSPKSEVARGYSPWRTLLPRFWMPAADVSDQQVKVGASTSGSDVLGRHVYSAELLYRVAGKAGAPGSPRYDWAAGYAYDRWLPVFFANASDRTHFLADVAIGPDLFVPADVRDQEVEAGVSVPDGHLRYEQAWTASFDVHHRTETVGPFSQGSNRSALRPSWWFASAKQYAYSISPEQGVVLGVAGEIIRPSFGADGTADDVTVDARAYVRLFGRHSILAVRGGAGASRGDFAGVRYFYLGGPGPNASPVDYGSDALNLLRGFEQNTFRGRHIVVANAEYRLPLVRVERGWGTFPVYLRTLHAAGFCDAGKTWDESYSGRPFALSAGVELSGDFRIGYELPITATLGIAWPKDPTRTVTETVVYFRFGRAF